MWEVHKLCILDTSWWCEQVCMATDTLSCVMTAGLRRCASVIVEIVVVVVC